MSDFLQCIEAAVREKRLFRREEAILAAVSGGLDSMVLLHSLAKLAPARGWRITVAHFNHQLRGRSSDADERLVERTARALGFPFVAGRADVRKFAPAHKLSVEMAARKLRHEFLARVALERSIKTIALAHHADDQVELFLLRLLRGSGTDGLAGMKWHSRSPAASGIFLARPLLGEDKASLRAWAAEAKLVFREDATNAQIDVQRNRIRHELLPLLARHYQPAAARVILRQMDIIRAEAEFVAQAAEKWLRQKQRRNFDSLPVALQRRCLQIGLTRLNVPAGFELIERLRGHSGRLIEVSPGVSVYRDAAGQVYRQLRPKIGPKDEEIRVKLRGPGGEFTFANHGISWQILPLASGFKGMPKNKVNSEQFDADKVGTVIGLRHWRPGDRFQPIGMKQAVKLQDLFVNQKIPRAERQELLVATTGKGELFWVKGLRMAERFKLDKSTRRGLKWVWKGL